MNRMLILGLAATVLAGCGDPDAPAAPDVYGSPVAVGNGEARTYVVMDGDSPVEIGVALSETALDGLPAPTGNFPDSHSYLLPLPAGNATGYLVVELNWNPAGHPPPMIYTVPHFDVHFYTQSAAARAAILPSDPDFGTKAATLPPANVRPAGYVVDQAGGQVLGIPMMGVHWSNPGAPEFHGQGFTSTFIYGSWDGEFTFVEPMVAYDYLKGVTDTAATIIVPSAFDSGVMHPSGYRIIHDLDAKEYRVAITGLEED